MESAKVDDPRGRTRTVPFKVLALGLSRSGTESLCKALTILGIPTYHDKSKGESSRARVLSADLENAGGRWKTTSRRFFGQKQSRPSTRTRASNGHEKTLIRS